MSSWAYCEYCNAGLPEPTIRQALENEYECHVCERLNDPRMSDTDVILRLVDRIEALEAKS